MLLHVYDCLPSVGLKKSETIVVKIPGDQSVEISYVNNIPDICKVSVKDIQRAIKLKSK